MHTHILQIRKYQLLSKSIRAVLDPHDLTLAHVSGLFLPIHSLPLDLQSYCLCSFLNTQSLSLPQGFCTYCSSA